MRAGHFLLMFFVLIVPQASARTWYVEKDGSGDFTVIQQAVDAAVDGDTIEIGPGRFDDRVTYGGNVLVVAIYEEKNLEFRGAGVGQTMIGPTSFDPNGNLIAIFAKFAGSHSVQMSGISFDHGYYYSVYINGGMDNSISNCHFFSTLDSFGYETMGVSLSGDQNTNISQCNFEGLNLGVMIYSPSIGVKIAGCDFSSVREGITAQWAGSQEFLIQDCRFSQGVFANSAGVSVYNGASGKISRCHFLGQNSYGCVSSFSGPVEILDNTFEVANGDAIRVSGSDNVTVQNNIVSSNVSCITISGTLNSYEGLRFNNNHLFRGPNAYFVKISQYVASPQPNHIDLRYNYFGTTDLEEINRWIQDANDFPTMNLFVDFLPLADGPVGTEKITLDGVKAMYR